MARTANVNICNQAIVQVGGSLIETIGEDSTEGGITEEIFEPTRDALIEAADWTFAVKRVILEADGISPVSGYDNKFTVPADMARALSVSKDSQRDDISPDWQLEDREIVSNEGILYLRYATRSATQLERWSEEARQALVSALAAKMAIPIAKSRTLFADLKEVAKDDLEKAKITNGLQGRSKIIRGNRFIRARFRGGSRRVGPFV